MGLIGDAWDWTKETAGDLWDTASGTFEGSTVQGPPPGSWGQQGTAASAYNQQQLNMGHASQERARDAGSNAQQYGWQNSQNAGLRQAPTTDWSGANAASAQGQQSRGGTQQTLNALNNFANNSGEGPSAAQAQLQSATNQNNANALALARSGRGFGGNAAAMGQAQGTLASNQANAANQSSMLRAQEYQQGQQNRLAALNSALGGNTAMRGQDLASQQQAANQSQFDVQRQLQQQQMNDAAGLGWFNAGNQANLGFNQLGENTALQRAQLGQNALNAQAQYQTNQNQQQIQAQTANQQSDQQRDAALIGTAGTLIGTAAMASDERLKTAKQRNSSLSKALDTVGNAPGYSYEYKDPSSPGAKPGRQMGPMAQDIERGPLGATIVINTPQGKMLDTNRLSAVNTSAITELNHKVRSLERALGKAQ